MVSSENFNTAEEQKKNDQITFLNMIEGPKEEMKKKIP